MIYVFDRAENIVEKGENAGYQHFLLFPQCFHKATSLGSELWGKELTSYHLFLLLMTLQAKPFKNITGKGENAGNQHFLLFP